MKMYPPGENPALSLYSLWEMLTEPQVTRWTNWLQTDPGRSRPLQIEPAWWREQARSAWWQGAQIPWARADWYVRADTFDIFGKPVFKFGRYRNGWFTPAFILDSKGRFQVNIRAWGARHALAAGTFLAYSYDASRYRWYVPLDPGAEGQWHAIRDWHNPIHSVDEWTTNTGAWKELWREVDLRSRELALVDTGRWKIAVSSWQCSPGDNGDSGHEHRFCVTRGDVDRRGMEKNDRLLARRFRLRENADRKARGLAPVSDRPARLRDGNQTLTTSQSIARLTALLDVEAPAKPRLTEAQEEIKRMSTTTWIPRMQSDSRQWLLSNGDVVTEPALEETTSGRKIRVAAMPHLNGFTKDFENLMKESVREIARTRGTQPWMRLPSRGDYTITMGGAPDPSVKAHLHLLDKEKRRGNSTHLWWRFKHASLPIEAYVSVQVMDATPYGGGDGARPNEIGTSIVAPDTRPNYFNEIRLHTASTLEQLVPDNDWQRQEALRQAINAEGEALWSKHVSLGNQKATSERDAAVRMLALVHQIEDLASIKVPDMRDPSAPSMLELEIADTNVSPLFLDDLKEYLDGAPTVEEAALHYGRTLEALRNAGMVLESKTSNEFLQALISGSKDAITVRVTAQAPESERDHNGSYHGDGMDHDHSVVLHLATGTVAVQCTFRAQKKSADEIAHAWEESLTMASLTGQEDTLLAYARKYVADAERKRAQQVVNERKHPS